MHLQYFFFAPKHFAFKLVPKKKKKVIRWRMARRTVLEDLKHFFTLDV